MSISIDGGLGGGGITVETDPTALKLTGGNITGDLTVSNKVGIGGVVPVGSTNKLAVHNGNIVFSAGFGIAFGDGTTLTTASGGGGGAVTSVAGRTGAVVLSNTDISGLGTMATASASDYSTTTAANGLYYPLSSNPAGYLTSASYPVTSVAGRTGAITLSNTDISGLGTMATASASNYSTKTVADGLYYPLSSNPAGYLTSASYPVTSVAGRTGAITLSNTDISGLGTMATASTTDYYPSTNPNGYIGSSGLANYALLSGATFTGAVTGTTFTGSTSVTSNRIIGVPTSGIAGVNIGIGGTSTDSTTAGDLWISSGGASLNYRDGTGAWRVLPALNNANTFSTNQVIAAATTSALLRITQTGTGNALLVEDTNNPDTTSFVITSNGDVGVGVPTNFTPTVKFEVDGTFKAVTITNGIGPAYSVNNVVGGASGTPTHSIFVTIGGISYRIPAILN